MGPFVSMAKMVLAMPFIRMTANGFWVGGAANIRPKVTRTTKVRVIAKAQHQQQYVMWYYGVLCLCVSSVRYWRWLLNAGVCVWLGPHVAIQAAKSSLMNMFPLDVWTVVWTQWGPANILPIHHIYSVDEIIDIWTLCALRSTHCLHVCVWHQSTDKRNAGDERQKEAE